MINFKYEVKLESLDIEESPSNFEDNLEVVVDQFQNRNKVTFNMLKAPNEDDSVVNGPRRSKRIKTGKDEFENIGDIDRGRNKANIKKGKLVEEQDSGGEDYEVDDDDEEESEGEKLSSYQKKILKNQDEKCAFLKSLKIDEAKASFIESLNNIKKKSKRFQKGPQAKIFIPGLFRKTTRITKTEVNFSEKALHQLSWKRASEGEKKKVMPPVLSFEEALQFKDLYQDFLKDFEFRKKKVEIRPKPVVYGPSVFGRMVIEESRIAKVVPNGITSLAIHPSWEKIVVCAGNSEGVLGIWNVESHTNPYVLSTHYGSISNLQFNPVYKHQLISSSYDGTVRLGDFESKIFSEVYNISNETSCTYFDFASPDTLLVAQKDGKVAAVDCRIKGTNSKIQCDDHAVNTVHVHPVKKNYFITAACRGAVCVWDMRRFGRVPVTYSDQHKRSVYSAYFSPVIGNYVLTTSADNRVCIFDSSSVTRKLKKIKTLRHENVNLKFRSTWIPNTEDAFLMLQSRRLRVFDSKGFRVHNFIDENLKKTTTTYVFHPLQPVLVAAGYTSGYVYLFKELC